VGGALLVVAGVLLAGVAGYLAAGWTFSDAVYMVCITMSTVGFTEVRPLTNPWLRAHTIAVIIFGYASVTYTLACLVAFFAEEELKKYLGIQRVMRQIDALTRHVIVVGLGRMGSQLCEELEAAGEPFLVLDRSPEKIAEVERRGWLGLQGEATEEDTLEHAGLRRARAIVSAVPDDAFNVFLALTARELHPQVQILTRAEEPSTQRKLLRAGANHVVLPTAIGAQRIASLLTNPTAVQFAELVTQRGTLEIEMDEVAVAADGPFAAKTLRDLDVGRRTGVIVLAIKRADGRVEFPPTGAEPLQPGDRIVLLGRRSNLDGFHTAYAAE
jgi:voltage-gated potassium channel